MVIVNDANGSRMPEQHDYLIALDLLEKPRDEYCCLWFALTAMRATLLMDTAAVVATEQDSR